MTQPAAPRDLERKAEPMPTHYLFGTILTSEAVAANNRGDNIGNTTTLQKVFLADDLHTSVSAESIRFALRYHFQLQGEKVNRTYDATEGKLEYKDEGRAYLGSKDASYFVDDDLMGFMDAKAAQQEQESEKTEDSEPPNAGKKPKKKGTTTKRTSPLAIGRAISLRPYRGEISFNCVSGVKEKGSLSLYSAEIHTTEYQYSFGLNLSDVLDKTNIAHVIDAIVDPPQVAGNHSRFAYDFSPASIILRVTSCHSSRIQNCFDHDEETRGYSLDRLIHRIEAGDIPATELIAGGLLAKNEWGVNLKKLGVSVHDGVLSAAREAKSRISNIDKNFAAVGGKGAAG
jgi:CRISPR-associated protein Cst2